MVQYGIEQDSEREHLMCLGAVAAAAAHEMRNPLCAVSVIIEDLLERSAASAVASDLRLISEQLQTCRRVLDELLGPRAVQSAHEVQVDDFLWCCLKDWSDARPGARVACRIQGDSPTPRIRRDRAVQHALVNLLDNAADESPESVELSCDWRHGRLEILVLDRGRGIAEELQHLIGKAVFSTKHARGAGVGLLLARTALQRAGGTLRLVNRVGGGACAAMTLPLVQPPA